MEKRNVVEEGRTPAESEKIAEVVDDAVDEFKYGLTALPGKISGEFNDEP